MDFHVQQALAAYKQPGAHPQGNAGENAGFAAEIAETMAADAAPLYENDTQIEQTLRLDILGGVPSELYQAVTEALLYVYRANKKAQDLLKHADTFMLKELYTAALGMIPQQTRLEVLANNIANANTAGFKREAAFEHSLIEARENLNNTRGDAEMEDTPTYSYTDYSAGALERTGNSFDIAIGKTGQYYQVTDAEGKEFYTRAGHFTLLQNGTLGTPDGKALMGESGPISVLPSQSTESLNNEKAITLRVADSGEVFANEQPVGKIQLFSIENPQTLERHTGAQFAASEETNVSPVAAADITVKQGYVENSNVNIISEMVEMIQLQRLFEVGQKVISTNDGTLDRSIDIGRFV